MKFKELMIKISASLFASFSVLTVCTGPFQENICAERERKALIETVTAYAKTNSGKSEEEIKSDIEKLLTKNFGAGYTIETKEIARLKGGLKIPEKTIESMIDKAFSNEASLEKLLNTVMPGKPDTVKKILDLCKKDFTKNILKNSVKKALISVLNSDIPVYSYTITEESAGKKAEEGIFAGGNAGAAYMAAKGSPLKVSVKTEDIKNDLDKIRDLIKKEIIKLIDKMGVFDFIETVYNKLDKLTSGLTKDLKKLASEFENLTEGINDSFDKIDEAWDFLFDNLIKDPGWKKENGYIYYYDKDGFKVKGLKKIKGNYYYFNKITGSLQTGWQIIDGKRAYFSRKDAKQVFSQWENDGEDRYHINEEGFADKDTWIYEGDKSYYIKPDGKMAKGWQKADGFKYYFDEKDGHALKEQWLKYENDWYYLKTTGMAAEGWLNLNGQYYYCRENTGVMQTGWFRTNGKWYCADDSGKIKTGWVYSEGKWYYLDKNTFEMKKNCWINDGGAKYYLNLNGEMITGTRFIDGHRYNFGPDGKLK